MEKPEGYPEVFHEEKASGESSWFWPGSVDDMSFESGEHDYYYSFHQSKFGKLSDPKLLALVEFVRELFLRRKELLPRLQDQLHEAAKKSGMKLWRVKSGNSRTWVVTMQRSLSLGSGSGGKCGDSMVNEWIKITTINTGGGDNPKGGSGGQVGGGYSG